MKYFATGAARFIGSHLCERLISYAAQVVCIDNLDDFYDPRRKRRTLAQLMGHPSFSFVEGDIRDGACLDDLFEKHAFDAVIHLAAKAGVRPSILDPFSYIDVNVRGTAQVLETMRRHKVQQLIFASSSSVYGNGAKVPFSEEGEVGLPISPYAATKRSGELLCHAYHHLYGLNVACLRFFTVYGPRQRPDLAIHKFTQLALRDEAIPLYGDGQTRRDYTFVEDIVTGIVYALQKKDWGFDILNLGCGAPVTLLEMVQALEKALNKPLRIQYLDKQPGDVEQTHADIEKAKRLLGYAPTVHLQEGVARFLKQLEND